VFDRLTNAQLSRPWLSTLMFGLALTLAIVGCLGLKAQFSAKAYFGSDDPQLTRLEAFHDRWGADYDRIAVVIEEPDLASGEGVARLHTLGERLRLVPGVAEVVSMADLPSPVAGPGVPLIVVQRDNTHAGPMPELLGRPIVVPTFLSADGSHAAIMVRLGVDADNAKKILPVTRAMQRELDGWRTQQTRTWLAGIPAIRAELLHMILVNQAVLIPAVLLLILAALWFAFRRWQGVVLPLVAAVTPVVFLLGFMGAWGEPLGILNQVYFTLIPVIAVADAIHLLTRHEETGDVRTAVRDVAPALLVTTLTTVAGFLSMLSTSLPALRSFGLFAALGLVFALATVLWVLPLLLEFGPLSRAPHKHVRLEGLLGSISGFAVRFPAPIALGSLALLLGLLALGSRVEVGHEFARDIPPDAEAAVGSRLLDEELGGLLSVELEVSSPSNSRGPELASAVRGLAAGLRLRDETRTVVVTPAQTHGMARISVRTADPGAVRFVALAEELEAEGNLRLSEHGARVQATGTPLLAYRGISRIASDLRTSLWWAFGTVALLIAVLFRSLRAGLVSLLPNVLPLAAGYAMMGVLGWTLNPVSAVVFAIALGLAADDTVHLLARYQQELDNGRSPEQAVAEAVRTTGRAIWLTSVILIAGFGVNALSSFPTNATFGGLGAVIIAVALLADLLVLPAWLVWLERLRPTTVPEPTSRT